MNGRECNQSEGQKRPRFRTKTNTPTRLAPGPVQIHVRLFSWSAFLLQPSRRDDWDAEAGNPRALPARLLFGSMLSKSGTDNSYFLKVFYPFLSYLVLISFPLNFTNLQGYHYFGNFSLASDETKMQGLCLGRGTYSPAPSQPGVTLHFGFR